MELSILPHFCQSDRAEVPMAAGWNRGRVAAEHALAEDEEEDKDTKTRTRARTRTPEDVDEGYAVEDTHRGDCRSDVAGRSMKQA